MESTVSWCIARAAARWSVSVEESDPGILVKVEEAGGASRCELDGLLRIRLVFWLEGEVSSGELRTSS